MRLPVLLECRSSARLFGTALLALGNSLVDPPAHPFETRYMCVRAVNHSSNGAGSCVAESSKLSLS